LRADLLQAGSKACVMPFISMTLGSRNVFGWRSRSLCVILMSRYEMTLRGWLMSAACGYATLGTVTRISERYKS
jgi:hypothetical protein